MEYGEYLKSEQWQKLRSKRLNIDNYQCQICGRGDDLQVHHITYANIEHEDIYNDLITLCRRCHEDIEAEKTQKKQLGDIYHKVKYQKKTMLSIGFAESIKDKDFCYGGNLNLCNYDNIRELNTYGLDISVCDVSHYFAELHYKVVKQLKNKGLSLSEIMDKTKIKYEKCKVYFNDDGEKWQNLTLWRRIKEA
jgi:hypothetical protein